MRWIGVRRQLLTAGVDQVSGGVVAGLLAATGRWPVLLALVNGAVRADLNSGCRVEESMREILHELRTTGPTALDVTDADERHTAVARTIGVSLSRLTPELLDAHRSLVADEGDLSAWWQLPAGQTYLWAWLPTHLRDAGLEHELRACLHHPGWLVGKLEHVGSAGLEVDLALSDDPLSRALEIAVRENAHVLGPLEPPGSLPATLAIRLPADGPTKALAEELVAGLTTPHLRAITTLPDLPHPALSRVLTGHTRSVYSLVVVPDGSWLAAAGDGGAVRIWDPATGTRRHTLAGHTRGVRALVVAPDGSWLACSSRHSLLDDEVVKIWNPATGTVVYILTGRSGRVRALAVAPNGAWLSSAGDDGEIRVWDPTTGLPLASLRVASRLFHLLPTSTTLAAAGEHGPYFLALCHGIQSR